MTPAQQRVYQAIADLEHDLGYGPSTREIAERAGLHSTSTVHVHLQHLLEAGLIRRASRRSGYCIERGRVVEEQAGLGCPGTDGVPQGPAL